MSEAIYKVGDVLLLGINSEAAVPMRALVICDIHAGYEYDNLHKILMFRDKEFPEIGFLDERKALGNTKRIAHVDLEPLTNPKWKEPEKTESEKCPGCETPKKKDKRDLDDWMLMTSVVMALRSSTDARELREKCEKLKEENEKLKAENKELIDNLSESESKAHSRLDRISFLMHKVDELENERDELKGECI